MNKHIKKVAVIGSGIMGSGIACHFRQYWCRSSTVIGYSSPMNLDDKEKAKGLTLKDNRNRSE